MVLSVFERTALFKMFKSSLSRCVPCMSSHTGFCPESISSAIRPLCGPILPMFFLNNFGSSFVRFCSFFILLFTIML